MFDVRVITAKALLQVNAVAPVRGFNPPSLMVIGVDLYKATEIEYNGVLATEWIVAAPNRLVVRIPETQVGQFLRSVRVFTNISLAQDKALVQFGVTSPLTKISGIDRLVQSWLLIFFTTPGSDVFDQASGGGGRGLIGKTTDRYHRGVAADLALCINRTTDEVLRLQAKVPEAPPEEKLLSGHLIGMSFNEQTSVLYAAVSLKNMVGDAAQLALG